MKVKVDDVIKGHFPHKGSHRAAGIDLFACVNKKTVIRPNEQIVIGSGVYLDMSDDGVIFGMVVPRSGWGIKGLVLANTVGIIDSDYQGEIKMVVKNTSDVPLVIDPLDRICQLIFLSSFQPVIDFVDSFDIKTERGDAGFGSSGK